jgi:hypothetical protein
MRQRSATLVETGSAGGRKTGGDKLDTLKSAPMAPSFMDNFQMQMTRFEAEMNDRIVKLDLF